MEDHENFGIEVVLEESTIKAPSCPHGPTLLFEKLSTHGKAGRRFYACSACRDRRDCNFFQWEDEKVSEARRQAREAENKAKQPAVTHQQFCDRLRRFATLPLDRRRFCQDCQLLLLPEEWTGHKLHTLHPGDITVAELRRPSLMLLPLENKKSNAQYLFADRSCHFLLDLLAGLGFQKVLCVGTPRLHELIKLRNVQEKTQPMKSLLLDIDHRYSQFYGEDEFCHYNMFNHHFFTGKAGQEAFTDFLNAEGGARVVMVTDPPFGGLVRPLAHSFSRISKEWRALQNPENQSEEMPMIWIFPYFFESRILQCLPTFTMLDYQVDYDNHPLYKHGKKGRKQSPVRLFTNLPPRDIALPEQEGYRFCSLCERYVSSGNKHCPVCEACTSKDGREWKHCAPCNKCVKPTWQHCPTCDRCALPDHPCGAKKTPPGCFECGSPEHKRRACPHSIVRQPAASQRKQPAGKRGRKIKAQQRASGTRARKEKAAALKLKRRRVP